MTIQLCLMFDGNCAEAMKFYQKCLKADLQIKLYSEVFGSQTPPPLEGRIMNARLTRANAVLQGADIMPQPGFKRGNNFTVHLACSSRAEVDEIAVALAEGGNMTMPVQDNIMGTYFGMLTDKYEVDWMLSCEAR